MNSLKEMVSMMGLSDTEKYGIIYNLIQMVKKGEITTQVLNPDTIMVDDYSNVTIVPETGENIAYAAPEILLMDRKNNSQSQYFCIGQILFYMNHGMSYFEFIDEKILSFPSMLKKNRPEYLIDNPKLENTPDYVYEKKLTHIASSSAKEREVAADEFCVYLEKMYKCEMSVVYKYQNNIVHSINIDVKKGEVYDLSQPISIPSMTGSYKPILKNVSNPFFSYRPGNYNFVIELENA